MEITSNEYKPLAPGSPNLTNAEKAALAEFYMEVAELYMEVSEDLTSKHNSEVYSLLLDVTETDQISARCADYQDTDKT